MRGRSPLDGSISIGATPIPRVVFGLIAVTLGTSIAGALTRRTAMSVADFAVLQPGLVWSGEVWRLLTWVFVETEPISLVFGCLALFWFGRDLALAWGGLRFLATYLGFAVMTAGMTCVVARLVSTEMMAAGAYFGSWPVVDALLIAWAVLYPDRRMLMYFVMPIGGRTLIVFVIGITILLSIFSRVVLFVPHLIAETVMLFYVREPHVLSLWLRLRLRWLSLFRRRRASRFSVVPPDDRSEPPRWMH